MHEPLNLPALMTDAPEAYVIYMTGRVDGRAEGYADGWAAAEGSMARLHRAAVRVVRQVTSLPELDPETCRRRALERESRWSA